MMMINAMCNKAFDGIIVKRYDHVVASSRLRCLFADCAIVHGGVDDVRRTPNRSPLSCRDTVMGGCGGCV